MKLFCRILTLSRIMAILFCMLSIPAVSHSSEVFQKLAGDLAESGHRDLRFEQNMNTLRIYYWPVGFRDEYRGYLDIREKTLDYLPNFRSTGIEFIEFIQTSWGVPTVTALIPVYTPSASAGFTRKYYPGSKNAQAFHPSKKGMVRFDIPLSINFGEFYDPLIFKTGLSPQLTYRLSDTVLAYSQIDVFFHNEYDVHEHFKPGNVGLMIARPLRNNIMSVTNIGAFRENLYGIDQELSVSFLDDMIALEFHGGIYGDQVFHKNEFKYKKISHKHALLKMVYSHAALDSRITLLGGRFVYGDKGIGAELSRTFKEVEIGFTGIKTGGDLVVNIFFSVPMFPRSRKSMAKHGVSHVKNFELKYWYYLNKLGREPRLFTDLDGLNGLSNPAHYKFMSENE